MTLRSALRRAGAAASRVSFALMYAVAFALSPWRLGRMLTTVSLPRMREHPLRTNLTMLGIALGVAVLVSVVLVSRSIVLGVEASVDDLAGKADLQVHAGASGLDDAIADKLREVAGVYKVAPVVQQMVTLRTARGRRERLLVLGVDMLGDDDSYFRDYESRELEEIRRDPLSFLNSTSNIIVSRELADRIGIKLHDKVFIGTGAEIQSFDVWGFSDEGAAVNRAFGGSVAIMYFAAMQVAFGRGHSVDTIDLAVEPGRDPAMVAQALKEALGPAYTVERPALRGERVSKMLDTVQTALTLSSVIAMLAGAFLVFNTIAISIAQRRRELAILKALGMTRRQQANLLTLEGALLGCVGAGLGILGGLGLSRAMLKITSDAVNEVYLQQAVTEVHLDRSVVLGGFLMGIAFAVVAAFLAAQSAAKIRAISAFTASAPPSARPRGGWGRTEVLGVGLLGLTALLVNVPAYGHVPVGALGACLALLLSGRLLMPWIVRLTHLAVSAAVGRYMGVEVALANDNLPRDLERSASTASGLMAGVALTVGVATFITSFITSLENWTQQVTPGDLFVTSGARVGALSSRNTPMLDSFRAELLSLPQVAQVRRLRHLDAEYEGSPIKLAVTDMRELVKHTQLVLLEGTLEQIIGELERGGVIVSENFARRYGVARGATITLSGHEGDQRFPVAAVAVDYTSDGGTVTLDWGTFVKYWADPRVDTYELHLRAGVEPETVRNIINERWGDARDLFVLTNREFRGEFVKAVDNIFSLMHVLEMVTLFVAALGIVTSVLANVLDRVREIGVLRALGMLRRQIRKIVITEATLLGGVGILAGMGIGLVFGYILLRHVLGIQMGWYLPYELPLRTIGELALITLPVSALAGLLPARHAASLVVADALEYE